MKILIVYYSRTGSTKKVAEALQTQLACDIEEIKTKKSYAGPVGFILAGKEASQRALPEIEPTEKNLANYDLVILGTPIWAWNISSPLRTYINKNKEKFSKVAVFCTMGGDFGKAFEEIELICNKKLEAKIAIKTKDIVSGNLEVLETFVSDIKK
jgi:flavodoxin